MALDEIYNLLVKDLAGSTAKNRFRNELLWGIKKIYYTYTNSDEDFFIIFDYACDIELGMNGLLYLYQIKTKRSSGSNFTIHQLTTIGKEDKHSILSNLLRQDVSQEIKELNIVANRNLKCVKSELSNTEFLCLDDLEDTEKKVINDHIISILGDKANLKKCNFIFSNVPLIKTDMTLLGETVEFLNTSMGSNENNATHFYAYLRKLVEEKATYELYTKSLTDTIDKKGITRADIDLLLKSYRKTLNIYSKSVLEIIDCIKLKVPYLIYIDVKNSFSKFSKIGLESLIVSSNIQLVMKELNDSIEYDTLTVDELIIELSTNIVFDNIIDYSDRICIVCIALYIMENEVVSGE